MIKRDTVKDNKRMMWIFGALAIMWIIIVIFTPSVIAWFALGWSLAFVVAQIAIINLHKIVGKSFEMCEYLLEYWEPKKVKRPRGRPRKSY